MMNLNSIYRMMDANGNRACEGLRTAEDVCRFVLNSGTLSKRYKTLRHQIAQGLKTIESQSGGKLWINRDTPGDLGVDRKAKTGEPKANTMDIFRASCRRAEEALRVLEESAQVLGKSSLAGLFAQSRYDLYTLESESLPYFPRTRWNQVSLYVITDRKLAGKKSIVSIIKQAIAGGAGAIQLRDPEMPIREKIKLGRELRKITSDYGVIFIINDRPDLALILEADGIHLGQDDMPVHETRALLGYDVIIGKSTHSLAQALQADKESIDYLSVGPIFKTTSKSDALDPVGLDLLKTVKKEVHHPITAIGGISSLNINSVIQSGADTIAVISAVMQAKDVKREVSRLRITIHKALKERANHD